MAYYQLGQIMLAALEELYTPFYGTADSGSTTTIVDADRTEPDEYFNGGLIYIMYGQNSGDLAEITTWDLPTKTFTFEAMGSANGTGDIYKAFPAGFDMWAMIDAANKALKEIKIPKFDVSLTTVANQEAYDIPAGHREVIRVEIATETASPYEYQEHNHYDIIDGDLIFRTGYVPDEAGYKIRLTYQEEHDYITSLTDLIQVDAVFDRLKWKTARYIMAWKVNRTEGQVPHFINLYNNAIRQDILMDARHPQPGLKPSVKYANW